METKFISLISICIGGGFGGIVLGIIRETSYRIRIPGGKKIEIGFVGDALIGSVAAVAVFAIAEPILNIDISKSSIPSEFLKIIAIAIIAGFSGISLLNKLSDNLVDKVNKVTKDIENIKLHDRSNEFIRTADFFRGNEQHEEALLHYTYALKVFPENVTAKIGIALTLRKLGRLEEAYQALDGVVTEHPDESKGWYNRACYGCLLRKDRVQIFQDLRQAIEIFPQYASMAKGDPDLSDIKDCNEFKDIIGNNA